jgi:hypothetical protein
MEDHGKNCECCKNISPAVRRAANTAAKELLAFTGKGMSAEKKHIIKELEKINQQLAPAGGINDLVQLTKRFFEVKFDEVKISSLGKPDPKKKIGKFKLIDILDNPTIDISKVINFKGLNLSLLNKLKISITVPTITAEKTLKFGPITLGIKFLISLKDISWSPIIHADFDTPEKALAALKDAKVKKPVTASEGKSLSELQKLAKDLVSPSLKKDLQSATTADEFFKKLDANKITLVEEKNIGQDFANIYNNAKKTAALKPPEKIGCEDRVDVTEPAPFTTEEVSQFDPCKIDDILAQQQAIVADEAAKNIKELQKELKEINELAKSAPTASTITEAKKALDDFLGKSNECSNKMHECTKKKMAAKERLDIFKQVQILHEIPLTYLALRKESYRNYGDPFSVLIQKRDSIREKIKDLIGPTAASSIDPIPGSTAAATPVNLNYELAALQTELQSVENQYNSAVAGFIKATDALENELTTSISFLGANPIIQARQTLLSENSTISNQVGFDNDGQLQLLVEKGILKECLVLYQTAVGTPTPAPTLQSAFSSTVPTVSGAPQIISNYFRPTIYDFSSQTPEPPRTGLIEESVWKKYYSPNRIDELFTYKEQGYTAPKPQYDASGKVLGAKKKVEFVNGLKAKVTQEVPNSVAECQVDLPIATNFLENIEKLTEAKIVSLIQEVKSSSVYKSYITRVKKAAELEARLSFDGIVATQNFSTATASVFTANPPAEFERSYVIAKKIKDLIQEKIKEIQSEIAAAEACIESSKKCIENSAKAYAEKVNGKVEGLEESDSIKKEAMAKLGSDPVGATPGNPQFPNYSKNCYWKEYTKILQTVSLMPIPDTEFLNKRLFRYYPIALQFPAGPAPLPTLASGIPDALISIPLPYLWVHLVTISTPFGLFVIWIALAGGFIPNPFIMFIDEKNEPMFLLTPRGPVDLPASQLGIQADEFKSVLDYLKINKTLKIDMGFPTGKLVTGSTRGDATDPDDAKSVIEGIKGKIKKSLDDLEFEDPDFAILTDEAREKKEKIKKALEKFPPDPKAIDEALKSVMKIAEKKIDELKISPIKIPKNPKKLAIEPPPISEMLETFTGLIDGALSAPEEVLNIVMKDMGIGIKTLDVKKKLTDLAKSEIEKPEFQEKLAKADEKIDVLEEKIANSKLFSADAAKARQEKIEERVKAIKEFLVDYIKGVTDKITPEMIGFIAIAETLPPLPVPCFSSIAIPPAPPWVALALTLIKQIPSIINAIDEKQLAELLANAINLEKPLPRADKLFYATFDKLLSFVPDVKIPTDVEITLTKNIKKALGDWLKTYKMRLPKVGQPVQIVIPPALIKGIIKKAFTIFAAILIALIMAEINKALQKVGPEAVGIVVAAIAIIKMLLGVDLHQVKGTDIKAFVKSIVESVAYPALDEVQSIIDIANKLKGDFKSIKETFAIPDPKKLLAEIERGKGPFLEVGTKEIKAIVDPLLTVAMVNLSKNLPYPVILLGCSLTPSRLAFTKLNPTKGFEVVPSWEGITTKNIPFIVWLDQLAASAQRYSLFGSDYVAPYFTPPSI